MNTLGSRSAAIWALIFAVGGVGYAFWRPTPANFVLMASMLLLAWNMAFTPGPSLRNSMRNVYARARGGTYRTSMTAKLVTMTAVTLFVAGIYLNLTQ
jgi:hypothetical protein